MNLFDLNTQYLLYLERVGLSESTMAEQQAIETKRAFMGACGQMLHLLTDGVEEMTEEQALPKLTGLFNQANDFWQAQLASHLTANGSDPEEIKKLMESLMDK